MRLEALPPPTQGEVARLLRVVRHRALRLLEKEGPCQRQAPRMAQIEYALSRSAGVIGGEMKHQEQVEKILLHHLEDKNGKIILLSGPWGCGKTFLWRTKISPPLEAEKPITLSLFGIESLSALKVALMNASLFRRASLLGDKEYKAAAKNFSKLLGAGVRKGIDLFIGSEFLATHLDPVQLIEENLVICLDDLERTSSSLSLKEIFGFATLLAETKSARILLITNDSALADAGEETAIVLRQYKERVVHHQITLEADIETTYSLFISQWGPSTPIHSLLQRERAGITSAFSQSEWSNLRTLSRVISSVAELARVLGPENVKTEHALLVTALRIESDRGSLQVREFYNFNAFSTFGFARKKESPLNASRLEFIQRNYGKANLSKYSFSPSIYFFITNGYFLDNEARAELLPPSQQLSEAEQILSDLKAGRWFFLGDTELEDLASRIESVVTSTELLTGFQLFSLWIYLSLTLRRIDKAPSKEIKNMFSQRVLSAAARLDRSFDHMAKMYFTETQDIWKDIASEYDLELARQENAKRLKELEDIIGRTDVDAFSQIVVKNTAMLNLALSNPSFHQILYSWRKDRRFHFQALSLIAGELEAYNVSIIPGIDKLRTDFAHSIQELLSGGALDISDRKRLEQLQEKTRVWAQESRTQQE